MISMKTITSAGGAAKYLAEQAEAEYYTGQSVPSQWHGKGAELQGLFGPVSYDDLVKQLEGRVKEQGEDGTLNDVQLGVERKGELQHRCGWDLTFSAPKSVSIESEVFGRDYVREAHEQAVLAAMRFLEEKAAQSRKDGAFVRTGNLTYSTFQHATSRAGDPQTHTHVVVANVTFDEHGKAYSLSNERLMEFRTAADAIYKNELANTLVSRGYGVQFDRQGNFEITGYSQKQLEVFSKRNEQIKDALHERGLNKDTASHGARQTATLSTRQSKEHSDVAENHRDRWQKEAEEAGITRAQVGGHAWGYSAREEAGQAVEKALDHLLEREMAFSERELWLEAAKFSQGKADLESLKGEIQKLVDSGELVERTDGKFTSQNAINAEKEMHEHLRAGRGDHLAVMTSAEFQKSLFVFEQRKGFELSGEQRNAAKMILTGDDRFQGVQGLAGTGKTTMLEFVREAAEAKGWIVQGFSNGGAQADKLEIESGISSTTTARFNIDFAKLERDAKLAQAALQTFEDRGGKLGEVADLDKLMKEVKEGRAQIERDSTGREYILPRDGGTYCRDLYEQMKSVDSPNLQHLGLTSSKYVLTNEGVFKQGGSLMNEAASKIMDKVYDITREKGVIGKVAEFAADKTVGFADKWVKCGIAEAAAVRAVARAQTFTKQNEAISALSEQANKIGLSHEKVLNICDEASMSGQREFSKVIHATEQTGARTVFLGDSQQHQSVEAGKAFELAQASMTTSSLGADSIRRQTTDHAKDMVASILSGKYEEAMSKLPVKEVSTAQDAVREKYVSVEILTPEQKKAAKDELAMAAEIDNKEVIALLARDYADLGKDKQAKTLVITATNSDKHLLNEVIRSELKASGQLKDGKQTTVLEKADLSKQEASVAANYEAGHVVQFTSALRGIGIEKGEYASVEKSDSFNNLVTVRTEDGRSVSFDPVRVKGVEVFNERHGKEFSAGDRVAFTKNDKDLDVKNGQTGVVKEFDGKNMSIQMENGTTREVNLDEYRHIDYAYAVTSFKSQGQTVDLVMNHHNTEHGKHGDRETYVNFTRAKEDVLVYTQNAEKASEQSGVILDKESAMPHGVRPSAEKAVENERQAEKPVEREKWSDYQKSANKEAPSKDERQSANKSERSQNGTYASSSGKEFDQQTSGSIEKDFQPERASKPQDLVKENGETLTVDERRTVDALLASSAVTTFRENVHFEPNWDALRAGVGSGDVAVSYDSFGREYFHHQGDTYCREAWEAGKEFNNLVTQSTLQSERSDTTPEQLAAKDAELANAAIWTANMNQNQEPSWGDLRRGLEDGSVTRSIDSEGRIYYHKDEETFTKDAFDYGDKYEALREQAAGVEPLLSVAEVNLARDAIATYGVRSGEAPNWESLKDGVENGSVSVLNDSSGREYFQTELGETFVKEAYGNEAQRDALLQQAQSEPNVGVEKQDELAAEQTSEQGSERVPEAAERTPEQVAEQSSERAPEAAERTPEQVAEQGSEREPAVAERTPEQAAVDVSEVVAKHGSSSEQILDTTTGQDAQASQKQEAVAEQGEQRSGSQESESVWSRAASSSNEESFEKSETSNNESSKDDGKSGEKESKKERMAESESRERSSGWDMGR